jgi:hypothetical protein
MFAVHDSTHGSTHDSTGWRFPASNDRKLTAPSRSGPHSQAAIQQTDCTERNCEAADNSGFPRGPFHGRVLRKRVAKWPARLSVRGCCSAFATIVPRRQESLIQFITTDGSSRFGDQRRTSAAMTSGGLGSLLTGVVHDRPVLHEIASLKKINSSRRPEIFARLKLACVQPRLCQKANSVSAAE